ncbi:MAG: exonuclease SbcCD subunit D [Eubacteriales bacterium]
MLKIIHTADIHLDSPFSLGDAEISALRREELREMFRRLCRYIGEQKADLVLIAGDLFDRKFITKNTVDLVVREFSALPDVRFVITPGNHDYYSPDSIWAKTDFPENVTVFKNETLSKVSMNIRGKKVDVYGYAFTSISMDHCPFTEYQADDPDAINILVAHGNMLQKNREDCPITFADIRSTNFDYIALGHIHNLHEITSEEDQWYGYCGSPEPRDFGETGWHGVYTVEMDKNESGFLCKPAFVKMASRRYMVEALNVTGAEQSEAILEAVQAMLSQRDYGEETLLRIKLTGDVAPAATLPTDAIRELCQGLAYVEIIDETSPLFDYDYLAADPTIRGAYFRQLLPKLRSIDVNEREVAAMALRCGLSVLGGGELPEL